MTLRCECGGHIEITSATESRDGFTELYECPECGRTGGYRSGGDTWGCVTEVTEVPRF